MDSRMHKVVLCVFCGFLCGIAIGDCSKLRLVQILYRHGDRTPIELFPNDPNPEKFWVEGLGGKLTNLGKRQHYVLGNFFRKMYKGFATPNPYEVRVMSDNCSRCIMSAESNTASFFAPGNSRWRFDEQLDWQPIPISYTGDEPFHTGAPCPRISEERRKVVNSPASQKLLSKYREMFRHLTLRSGSEIKDWKTAGYLYDTLLVEKTHGLEIPSWVKPYWNALKEVAGLQFFWHNNSPILHRLRAGPFLKKMIHLMEKKIAGIIPALKFQIYSGHDYDVAGFLSALNLFNMKAPPYCASIILELHELSGGEMAVRLLHLNSTAPENGIQEPNILTLEGCSEYCPLNSFKKLTKKMIPGDWKRECQVASKQTTS